MSRTKCTADKVSEANRECLITYEPITPKDGVFVLVVCPPQAKEGPEQAQEGPGQAQEGPGQAQEGPEQAKEDSGQEKKAEPSKAFYFLQNLDTLKPLKVCPKTRHTDKLYFLCLGHHSEEFSKHLIGMNDDKIRAELPLIQERMQSAEFKNLDTLSVEAPTVASSDHTVTTATSQPRLTIQEAGDLYLGQQSRGRSRSFVDRALREDLGGAVLEEPNKYGEISWEYIKVNENTLILGGDKTEQDELFRRFCQIYRALQAGQSSILPKTNFLNDIHPSWPTAKKWLMVIGHMQKKPSSRKATAYRLLKAHCLVHGGVTKRTDEDLFQLKREIYLKAFKASHPMARSELDGHTFFRAKALVNTYDSLVYEPEKSGNASRRAKIERAFQ